MMTPRLVNPYTVRPGELKSGDVLVFTVTCHIIERANNRIEARIYRCPYDGPTFEGIPQGSRTAYYMQDEEALLRNLFPVVLHARSHRKEGE